MHLPRRTQRVAKQDIYAYNPTYEWTSYKTVPGMVCSWLSILFIIFYMVLTLRDYIVRPPELVSQGDIDLLQTAQEYRFAIPRLGIRLFYTNVSDPTDHIAALDNRNPFVKLYFRHVIVRNQVRVHEAELPSRHCIVSSVPSVCPVVNKTEHMLQGIFYKPEYHFLEIVVDKCTGCNSACAPIEEINDKLASGEFRIRAQVSLEAEQFDVERFHATGVGSVASNRSMEYFNLPNVEVQSDIIFKARKVSKEQRYIGSPPMPEIETNILSFDRRETNYRPRSTREINLMSFVFRIDDNVRLEEVSYWCPSILDLFGLWGAMASFAASLSIGFLAKAYNKWSFEHHLKYMTKVKRREAQLLTLSSMEWMRKKGDYPITRNRKEIYKSLQEQLDALMVEPDLRLFESHHFDCQGRVAMSAAELKFPSTAFGELRRLAILEHGKKKRAAEFISLWYGRKLVKKGFITDRKRCRELFAPPFQGVELPAVERSKKRCWLRRRLKSSLQQLDSNHGTGKEETRSSSSSHDQGMTSDASGSSTSIVEVPLGSDDMIDYVTSTHDDELGFDPKQMKALEIIAELDPLTSTDKDI